MALRRAVRDDAPAMLEILEASLEAEVAHGAMPHALPDRGRENAWLEHLITDPACAAWIAEVDGTRAGFGITARRGETLWLSYLFVSPRYQGRGLGSALLENLLPAGGAAYGTLVDASSRAALSLYLQRGLAPRGSVLAFEGALPAADTAPLELEAVDDWQAAEGHVDRLDREVFGATRSQDHRHWNAQGYAFRSLRSRSGEWQGYGRWSPSGRLGPAGVSGADRWPQALGALLGEMETAGIHQVRLMIPAENASVLRWVSGRGFHYCGMEVLLATQPTGDWSRYLIHRAALP